MSHVRGTRHLLVAVASSGLVLVGCGGDEGTGPENRSPSASISSPSDGATFVEGSQVTFQGSASDPDQGTLTGSALSWASDMDGDLGTGTTVSRDDLSVGDHVVTLTATDGEGATGMASVSITVEANQEPSASISSPSDGATFGEGAPVDFEGSGDDPEDGSLGGASLEWESDRDGALGTGGTVTRSDLSVGDHAVTLTATDGQGATAAATVSITVESNGQPDATITSPSGGTTFQELESISFQGSGSDPEDGALTGGSLVWISDLDGEFGTGESFTRDDLSSGSHTITLEATDSRNASTTTSVGITVEGEPTVTITSPADMSIFREGEGVTFQGSATDPADGPLTGGSLVWSSDLDGELGTGESISLGDLSGGGHTVTLTATDSDGMEGSASVQILVESPGFQIQTLLVDQLSSGEESTLEAALETWEGAITGDLEPGFLPEPDPDEFPDDVNRCLDEVGGVDDVLVCVFVVDIDGGGGTLAQAGPFFKRTTNGLPAMGLVFIDEADRSNSQLEEILVHEIGHVLGIGIRFIDGWDDNTEDLGVTDDPFFSGPAANDAFDDAGGEAYLSDGVPVENRFGAGTQGGHWREVNLANELMTGIINRGSNPLSAVTIAALGDMGYEVNLSAADSYGLPMPQLALWEADADATLSRPASSGENFGVPDGTLLSESVVAGANNGTWSGDPDGEVLTGLVRFGAPARPSGVTITSAGLRLTLREVDTETTGHEVRVVPVTSSWAEASVTWDDAPGFGGSPVVTFEHDACASCVLNSPDLLDLVRSWAGGSTTNHGLALRAPDASSDPTFSVGFWTRHADDVTVRPNLRVSAETDAAPLRARVTSPEDGLPMVNDILDIPVYGLTPDGRVVTPDDRLLRPSPSP